MVATKTTTKSTLIRAVSLFSSIGVAETYLKDIGIDVVAANEILPKRCELYKKLYPETKMICGDIRDERVFNSLLKYSGNTVDLLIASPPCQGISIAGKNRTEDSMLRDERNFLIEKVIEFINIKKPTYVFIENVPGFLKLCLPYKGGLVNIVEILNDHFGALYSIDATVLDSANFGVPQTRKRAVIRMSRADKVWNLPKKSKKRTTREAIGHLPSLESDEKSDISWHFSRKHTKNHILWLSHTPTAKSAFENDVHYPKRPNGSRIKGYHSSYRRIKWDEPAPTITMRNDAISSQRNVHPGRKKRNGTYTDARVLSPKELMILSSLPENWKIPTDTPEKLIRDSLGECIPPLMVKKILKEITLCS